MLDLPCVIFAGGKSSRMGEDKSLLPFGEFATLTQFLLHKLTPIFSTIYISCKDRSKFGFEASFIEDDAPFDTYAPTVAFYTILNTIKDERFFAISVDTPFITDDIIKALDRSDRSGSFDASVAKSGDQLEPLCGIYHASLKRSFLSMLQNEDHKLMKMLQSRSLNVVEFESSEAFLNLNHPKEYQEALKLLCYNQTNK